MNRKVQNTKFTVGQTFETKSGRRYRVTYVEVVGGTEYLTGEYLDSPYGDEDTSRVPSFGRFDAANVDYSFE